MIPLLPSVLALAVGLGEPQPPPPADAAPPPARISLGVRAGVALPLGQVEDGLAVGDVVSRGFPLALRAAWRLGPALEVGLDGGWAPGVVGPGERGDCMDRGVTCSAHLWTLAARAEVARRGGGDWTPWGAASLGWERLSKRWELSADDWERKAYDGWLAGLEAGVDSRVKGSFDLGVFVGLSLGQARWVSVSGAAPGYPYSDAGAVPRAALHGWISAGLRGTFAL